MDRQKIINLTAAIAAVTVFGFTLGLMFPLLSLIMEKQGISADIIGYNTAMQPLGIVLSLFFIPIAVRKLGAKGTAIGSSLMVAAVIVAYPFVPIFWGWFALRIVQGFFVSMLFAISEAWIVKFADGPYRSRFTALYASVMALSFGGGPSIISFTGIDGPLPFLVGAVVLCSALLPILFVKDEQIDEEDERPLSVVGFVSKAPFLVIAVGAFAVVDAAFLGFLPVFGVKKGLSHETAAMALTFFIIGNTVLQFPIGWIADHMDKKKVIVACAGVTAVCVGLLPLTFGTWVFWLLLLIGGATSAGMYTVSLSALGDRFSGHELTTGTACFSTTWGVGALMGALGAGLAFETYGANGLPYSVAIVLGLIFLAVVPGLKKKPIQA
ncbi:MAG: MFS transporter [Proteobacteria bacterium]|nr:MFS transporter [Pseudomonadota bacterium]